MTGNSMIDGDNGEHPMSPYYQGGEYRRTMNYRAKQANKKTSTKVCPCCKKIRSQEEFVYKDKCTTCFSRELNDIEE